MENEVTKVLETTPIEVQESQSLNSNENTEVQPIEIETIEVDNKDVEPTTNEVSEETPSETTNCEEQRDTTEERRSIVKALENLHNNQGSDLTATIVEYRKLQADWKALGNEKAKDETQDIWKEYNYYQEKFYDLTKINKQLIEYNFKKNLELKTQLCANAEQLLESDDITKSFRALQNIHKEWKEVGHVSRELSDEIWARFKEVSDKINNSYTEFLNANKERNEEITNAKIAWCEDVEKIDLESLVNYKDWEETADRIKEINKLFIVDNVSDNRTNQQLYKRLRVACDNFFEQKSQFYANKKDEMQVNLEKKIALLARAEELKNSTDWKSATAKIIDLQKEWKTIGPTNHKNSKSTWEQFIAACDYFFEQKNQQFSSKKDEEKANLQLKKELVERIEKYELSENENENIEQIKEFYKEFNEIGHVPFKEKDKIYELFKDAIDKQYDSIRIKFHINGKNYGNNRQKLLKRYDQLKAEISTCENNIGFFSSSKKSNSLEKDLQRKINNLKVELTAILDQLNKLENEN